MYTRNETEWERAREQRGWRVIQCWFQKCHYQANLKYFPKTCMEYLMKTNKFFSTSLLLILRFLFCSSSLLIPLHLYIVLTSLNFFLCSRGVFVSQMPHTHTHIHTTFCNIREHKARSDAVIADDGDDGNKHVQRQTNVLLNSTFHNHTENANDAKS